MSPDIAAQLAQLRDIRLPEPIGWWPLAPGWWLLLALISLALLAILAWTVLRKRSARYLALRELGALDAADPAFSTRLSVLLRRVARRKNRGAGVLQDSDWIAFLTGHGMAPALAEHLAAAPYAEARSVPDAPDAPDVAELRAAAARWIRSQT